MRDHPTRTKQPRGAKKSLNQNSANRNLRHLGGIVAVLLARLNTRVIPGYQRFTGISPPLGLSGICTTFYVMVCKF